MGDGPPLPIFMPMTTTPGPTASSITVPQTLDLLDGSFHAFAEGVASGGYVFWLGSGISRGRLADLRSIVLRVLEHLHRHSAAEGHSGRFHSSLMEALGCAQLSTEEWSQIDLAKVPTEWPVIKAVVDRLCWSYSRLLDVGVDGEAADYLLWEVVDVPHTDGDADDPDCEHFCIAILAIEGVARTISTANWDGLIERAASDLSDNLTITVCVLPEDLRAVSYVTRLVKFHGCAVRATRDPDTYRRRLIARESQITGWSENKDFDAIREELIQLAATQRTLMIGMSAQDTNIKNMFVAAQQRVAWTWPASPPPHVFAEDALQSDQVALLRAIYQDTYSEHRREITESALLRAYAKPLLVALVLFVIARKLAATADTVDAPSFGDADRQAIRRGLLALRDRAADAVGTDHYTFVRRLATCMARGLSIFLYGDVRDGYIPISKGPVQAIEADAHMAAGGMREMACTLGLLGLGDMAGDWQVDLGDVAAVKSGAMEVVNPRARTRVFFAANERAAVQLEVNGYVTATDDDAVVIHSTAPVPRMPRAPRSAPGRTGHVGLRHVGMRDLLHAAPGVDESRRRFREESGL